MNQESPSTRFWLATFDISAAAVESPVGSTLGARTSRLAIEVLHDANEDEWAVLFSSVDDPLQPGRLTCEIGFTNAAKACNVWLDRGFPLIDAAIAWNGTTLTIVSPFFVEGASVMRYETPLLALSGIDFGQAGRETSPYDALDIPYEQCLQSPDGAQPDVLTTRMPVTWSPERFGVRKLPPDDVSDVQLDFGDAVARCPSLAPLAAGAMTPRAAWTGTIRLPRQPTTTGERLAREKVNHGFGVPAFRFEEVEILGFRIDLADLDDDVPRHLATLIKPLNFHLSEPVGAGSRRSRRTAPPDFRYRVATQTLIVELLRYGRMKARVPVPPLEADDSQSQHELVVRLLVGRVNDDTAQAHDPAVHAPAIFVDNPWSKVLGRDAIGYDKRLAAFCVRRDDQYKPLLPDGRLPNRRRPEPLGDIRHIRLVGKTGFEDTVPLLDLRFLSSDHTDPDALIPIDLDLAFGTSTLAGTGWRQSDFDDVEFRRSFASTAVANSVRSFRSIQVAPVVRRGSLEHTWITGTFALDEDVRAALPSGSATLTFHASRRDERRPSAPSAPSSWNLLCEMFGDGRTATMTVPAGSWYRLLCSMDLTIDDGLDWRT